MGGLNFALGQLFVRPEFQLAYFLFLGMNKLLFVQHSGMRLLFYFNNRFLYLDEQCHLHYYNLVCVHSDGLTSLKIFNDAGEFIDCLSTCPDPYSPPMYYCYLRPYIDTNYYETLMPHMREFLEHHNVISAVYEENQEDYLKEVIWDTKTGDMLPSTIHNHLFSDLVRVNDPGEWISTPYPFSRNPPPRIPKGIPCYGGPMLLTMGDDELMQQLQERFQNDHKLWLELAKIELTPRKEKEIRSKTFLRAHLRHTKVCTSTLHSKT